MLNCALFAAGIFVIRDNEQGKRYGRSARGDPAAFPLLVDAKDQDAAAFYRKNGFTPLESRPLTLFLPIATALKLLS